MDKTPQNAKNVVSMIDFHTDHNFPAVAQVEAYWDALRGTQLLPKRSDIDPRGIEAALEYAFILERISPGVARLRIAGSHLSDVMGMEVRGMPISAFLTSASRRRFSDMMEELFETPATGNLLLKSETGHSVGRMVLLPLQSDMGDVSRMLGCLVTKGDIVDSPCRFDIEHLQIKPIGNMPRSLKPVTQAPIAKKGFAEGVTQFDGGNGKSRPAYLRLVKTDS